MIMRNIFLNRTILLFNTNLFCQVLTKVHLKLLLKDELFKIKEKHAKRHFNKISYFQSKPVEKIVFCSTFNQE